MDRQAAALLAETDFLLGLDASPVLPRPVHANPAAAPEPVPARIAPTLGETGSDPAASLERLRLRHDAECPHCTVATAHTRTVFGEGNPVARLMFVGEAPGETEDRLGRPFVGRAGEKLDEMIRAMGLSREDVYIANVLKSRPPDNRTPLEHEVAACGPYLEEQIRIIRPEILVTLGGPATKLLLRTEEGITRLRGVWGELRLSTLVPGETLAIPVMPTFHPAYLLRNYTPETRRAVWHDLQQVAARLGAKSR
jgi:DNA polymerase